MREYITKKIGDAKTHIYHSKAWQHFKAKYPRAYGFVISRITLKDFTGLPLTILVIAIGTNLILITDFTQDVINSKSFVKADEKVSKALFSVRSEPFAKIVYIFTQVGNTYVLITASLAAIGIAVLRKKSHFVLPILVSILGCSLTVDLGKKIFKIARPHQLSYYPVDSYAFPSGHSAVAVAFYGLLFYFFIRHNYSFKVRATLIAAAITFALLVGGSRLYLCVHFLSDVLGGFMLGGFWLLLSISILEWEQYKLMRVKPKNYL